MPTLVMAFFVLIVFQRLRLSSGGETKTFLITNECNYTVWPSISSSSRVSENDTGFALLAGKSRKVVVQTTWGGRVWGRTLCSTDRFSGNFSCLTGDCGTGKIQCGVSSIIGHPTTLIEFTFGKFDSTDIYDTNLAQGYNLPMMVTPHVDSGAACEVTGCVFDDIGSCPAELQVLNKAPNGNSSIIGCKDACDVFRTNQYCCGSTGDCQPTGYSKIFKLHCPRAYSYNFDDVSTAFSCNGSRATSYTITFCPSPAMSRLLTLVSPVLPPTSSPSPSPTIVVAPMPFSPFINSTKNHTHENSYSHRSKKWLHTSLAVAVPTTVASLILVLLGICLFNCRRKAVEKCNVEANETQKFANSLHFDFNTIRLATHNFAGENKLGEGGFGEVFRGKLEDGQEIAVKRLSKNSVQGTTEFETEIVLVAKLQHKNLVKLLGYCAAPTESLLVYEFLPNSSLDRSLFDPMKKLSLNWQTRFGIIIGIAKGLTYLHEDSRIKVVHRDLKSSNILLDEAMNPKIADFGLARLFGSDQTQGDTRRIVGTYGYMAPEYAITGHYSVKSDVYSFGVIVLEIVSGQRNKLFGRLQLDEALLHRAWRLWNENQAIDLMDPLLRENIKREELLICIQIGLLCIQENAVCWTQSRLCFDDDAYIWYV